MQANQLQFEQPMFLAIAGGVLLIGILLSFARKQLWFPLVLRAIVLSLLFVALARPTVRDSHSEDRLTVLYDVSASISERGHRAFLRALDEYRSTRESELTLYPFAKSLSQAPLNVAPGTSAEQVLTQLKANAAKVNAGETNIEQAIREISDEPNVSSILLASDGFETLGEGTRAAQLAGSKGIRLFPLIPDVSAFEEGSFQLSSLYAPLVANAGDLVELRVAVKNAAYAGDSLPTEPYLEIWSENEKLYASAVPNIPSGGEQLITVRAPTAAPGVQRMKALLMSGPGGEILDEQHRWISVKTKSKMLLLSGAPDDARVLPRLLRAKGYTLEDIVADGNRKIPTSFSDYSNVILNNVAKRQLPSEFLGALRTYVEKGGGVILVGGARSFGLGGYIDTPLEEISPVRFLPPQTTKQRLNNAVILVLDKSRSMATEGRIEAAKLAALASINTLQDRDLVGVIGFDASPFVIIRLEPVSKAKPGAERRLRNLTAAGRTNILPSLQAARRSLAPLTDSRKHIIILSDGEFPPAGNEYIEEVKRLRDAGITVSAVAVGLEADVPLMKLLAKQGEGGFYQTLDPANLPEIFIHDIKVTTGEKTIQEQKDYPVKVGAGGLRSTTVERYPALRGFVETRAKDESVTELETQSGKEAKPILSSWSYRGGKVIAFTSDANGRWSDRWVSWDEFAKFWGELVEESKGMSAAQTELDFDLRYSVNRGAIVFDLSVFDPKIANNPAPRIFANIIEPGGEVSLVNFRTTVRGRFSGELADARPGDYRLELSYGDVKFPPLAITLPGDAFGEKQGQGVNVQNLSDIAFASEGSINPTPEVVTGYERTIEYTRPLHVPLIILAFVLLLAEAVVRERLIPQRLQTRAQKERDKGRGIYRPARKTVRTN